MTKLNRIHNSNNPYQGEYKRVLAVCSAGLLRSPSTAVVLASEPFNFNTRAAGLAEDYALIPVDDVLLNWAQEIVVMQPDQKLQVEKRLVGLGLNTPVICLDIPDSFAYRDEQLMKLIKDRYLEKTDAS